MRNDLMWPFPHETVSEEVIAIFEESIGVKFPKDYISCAIVNHGSAVLPYVFEVGGIKRVFGTLLSYDKQSNDSIEKVYNDYKNTLPKQLIPFAFDPAGNLICFDYKDHEKDPIVVFWEHENAGDKDILIREEGLTAEQVEKRVREHVFYVAGTFSEFLDKLHD